MIAMHFVQSNLGLIISDMTFFAPPDVFGNFAKRLISIRRIISMQSMNHG